MLANGHSDGIILRNSNDGRYHLVGVDVDYLAPGAAGILQYGWRERGPNAYIRAENNAARRDRSSGKATDARLA
jgi:hypothetical protein